jgi:hypothetical protein
VAWIGLLLLLVRADGGDLLSPATVLLSTWLAVAVFLMSGLVVYDRVFTGASFLSLLAAVGFFVIGTAVTRRYCIRRRAAAGGGQPEHAPVACWRITEYILISAAIAYIALVARDVLAFLASGGLTPAALVELRAEHNELALESRVTIASMLRAIVRAGATLLAIGTPGFVRGRRVLASVLGVTSILALSSESLLAGGRVVIAHITVAMVYVLFLTSTRGRASGRLIQSRIRFSVIALCLGMMGYAMFVVFPALRNPDLAGDVDFFLGLLHDARLGDWVTSASDAPGMGWLPVFAFASCYVSQPIVKYTFMMAESDIESWYKLGALDFPLLSKAATALTGSANPWAAIRAELDSISVLHGYAANPWSTGVRDLVADFGYVGMCLAMFAFGALWEAIYQKARHSPMLEWKIAAGAAAVMVFFFAFFSPFPLGIFSNTLLLAIGWAFIVERIRPARAPGALA